MSVLPDVNRVIFQIQMITLVGPTAPVCGDGEGEGRYSIIRRRKTEATPLVKRGLSDVNEITTKRQRGEGGRERGERERRVERERKR